MAEHLDYIQNVINRMANNSFLLKGWAVTLISLLFLLAIRDSNYTLLLLSLIPIFTFWGLDTYYLRQEKLYRKLYDAVRTGVVENDYSMNADRFDNEVENWFFIMFSNSIFPLYITITLLNILLHVFLVFGTI